MRSPRTVARFTRNSAAASLSSNNFGSTVVSTVPLRPAAASDSAGGC